MTFTAWPLRRENQVGVPIARAFWASMASGVSTSRGAVIIRSASSSMTTTIYGRTPPLYVRSSNPTLGSLGAQWSRRAVACLLVEILDVARAVRREELIALLHLDDRPLEERRGIAVIRDDLVPLVREHVVDRQLDHLRVDHQEPERLGRVAIDERRDQRVDADRLSRPCRAGNQEVRHLRQVGDDRAPSRSRPSAMGSARGT